MKVWNQGGVSRPEFYKAIAALFFVQGAAIITQQGIGMGGLVVALIAILLGFSYWSKVDAARKRRTAPSRVESAQDT